MTRFISYPIIAIFLVMSIYPFAWMFFSSFKTNQEIYQPTQLLPKDFDGDAYSKLWAGDFLDFSSSFLQSIAISSIQSVLATIVSALAGFLLAKYSFRGKGAMIGLAVLIILIPRQAMVVPIFEWFNWLGWTGGSTNLILCGVASGLGVVFFMQYFKQMPDELIEVSQVDGLSPFQTFILVLPLFFPALVTCFLLHFTLCWQDHLLALLLLDDNSITLPLALAKLSDSSHRVPEAIGMAAATLSLIPLLTLFGIFFGKMRTALAQLSYS